MEKKFIQSELISDYEILTDTGWEEIIAIHKTIPYEKYTILTNNFSLTCADRHIVFTENMVEIFVKDLQIGDKIITTNGIEDIIDIIKSDSKEHMYDLELCESTNKRYYTDNILSHNTTYIKYLTNCVTDKEIIFVPPSMAEVLSEPSIIPFLMDHKNSILIIEDAEKVISDRKLNGSSPGVSNILNLTDGILGDCLNIQIIATFNMEKEKIDEALLRKGRLIAEHKFGKLSVEDSNKLLEHLNKNQTTKEKMTLSDIYNIDEETIKSEDNSGKIGFYAHN